MADEIKFGNTVITVASEVVAKVTSFSQETEIDEEDVTGSEDVVSGSNVLQKQFVSIAVGDSASVEGIAIESASSGRDVGQSELKSAAAAGETVTMTHTRNTGYGDSLSGFFTSYEESADTGGVYKFKAEFRINSKTAISPSS